MFCLGGPERAKSEGCSLKEAAVPQAPGQADGGFNFIQIVPIKGLQGIG